MNYLKKILIDFLAVSQITSHIKANPDKWHLVVNAGENVSLKIRNETITNSSNQKLLRILFNKKFDFDEHTSHYAGKPSRS